MLVEKPGEIVAAEKLVTRFFPKSDSGEEELTGKILELRRVLEDTSEENPMLRCLPGQGYRFEAPVTATLADAESVPFGSSQQEENEPASLVQNGSQTKVGRMLAIAGAAIVLTILGVWGWRFFSASGGAEAAAFVGNSQMAVLPIRSLSGSAGDESFDRALTVAIIDDLAKGSQDSVVPAAAVLGLNKSTSADQLASARKLGVGVMVVGMAQELAGQVRVRLQMVRTEDGVEVWTGDFVGDVKDLNGLAAQIAGKIGKQIQASAQ